MLSSRSSVHCGHQSSTLWVHYYIVVLCNFCWVVKHTHTHTHTHTNTRARSHRPWRPSVSSLRRFSLSHRGGGSHSCPRWDDSHLIPSRLQVKPTVYSIMTHTRTQTHRCEARAHILMNAFKAQIQCEFTVHINKHRNSTVFGSAGLVLLWCCHSCTDRVYEYMDSSERRHCDSTVYVKTLNLDITCTVTVTLYA